MKQARITGGPADVRTAEPSILVKSHTDVEKLLISVVLSLHSNQRTRLNEVKLGRGTLHEPTTRLLVVGRLLLRCSEFQ